jgi:lipoprotein-releasing system ATP-binding protein
MLKIDNISRSFKEGKGELTVLDSLSFEIEKGERVALMGASGAGKTTLLQIIGGLDRPTGGEVFVDGLAVGNLKGGALATFRNRSIGFVFQFHHLLSDFTALENVMIPGLIAKVSKAECETRAMELLEQVGISNRATHHPAEMSGGERQRVALARALFNKPDLILADEPTGNLDRENSDHFLELVAKLNKENGQTFLIATHDELVAEAMDYTLKLANHEVTKV